MSDLLERLAGLAGIEPGYWDIAGNWHHTGPEAKRTLLAAMRIEESEASIGRLEALPQDASGPARCFGPSEAGTGRAWGITCQVYGLRSERNAGIGDLEDVALLAERLGREGADFLGLSPLHALFPEDPLRCSPYAPSSRRWLNEQLIAIDRAAVELGLDVPELPGLARLKEGPLIDWASIAAAKAGAFEELWHRFSQRHLQEGADSEQGRAFRGWRARHGETLERFCRFHALAEAAARDTGRPVPLREWPLKWRSPEDPAVRHLAEQNPARVEFRAFLQWVADHQLAQAQRRARAAGMRIGLYCDLAVGVVPDGAEAWAEPELMVSGGTIGAPPDPLGPLGQNWNIVAFSPLVMRETGGAPLRSTLQAVMRHAGAVRIDHVLGLLRLFLIPPGGSAADGAYVKYPFERLLQIVAEESRKAGCVVIGEDLGTVPDGFRPRLQDTGLLGYRVLWFEREWPDVRFCPPDRYPPLALATVSTHDLATVRGFFAGQDISWRERLGHFADPDRLRGEREARARDIDLLLEGLREQGLSFDPDDPWDRSATLHRFLARTASSLAAVQLEDLADELEQPNLPGTIDEHPNWRRRLERSFEEILDGALAQRIMTAMREERPR